MCKGDEHTHYIRKVGANVRKGGDKEAADTRANAGTAPLDEQAFSTQVNMQGDQQSPHLEEDEQFDLEARSVRNP